MNFKCPGSQRFSQPRPEEIICPFCGCNVEIWTDEVKAECPRCKRTIARGEVPSCIDWCKYAEKCLGKETYRRYMKNREEAQKLRKKRRG